MLENLFLFPIQGNPEIDVSVLSVVRATYDIDFEVTHLLLWLKFMKFHTFIHEQHEPLPRNAVLVFFVFFSE